MTSVQLETRTNKKKFNNDASIMKTGFEMVKTFITTNSNTAIYHQEVQNFNILGSSRSACLELGTGHWAKDPSTGRPFHLPQQIASMMTNCPPPTMLKRSAIRCTR